MNKFFLWTRFHKLLRGSTRTSFKHWKRYSPTSRIARVFKPLLRRSYKICHWRFFSYKLFNARKKKNLVQTSYLQEEEKDLPSIFLSYDLLNSRKVKDFIQQGTYKGNVPCVLNQELPFFWFTSIGAQKQPVLVEVLAPMRLAIWGSHVQRQYWKRTTLHSKSSTIKGLLYAHWRSRCKAFVARKVRTIAWAKRKKAVIWQATNAMWQGYV